MFGEARELLNRLTSVLSSVVYWVVIACLVLVEILWWTCIGAGVLEGLGVPHGGLIALAVVPAVVLLNRVEDLASARTARRPGNERAEDAIARRSSWILHEDDFGRLWDGGLDAGGQPIRAVQVVNATPEADGSFRHYFLRVPPDVHTAREAVAWTFGLEASEYAPVKEA